MDFNLIAQHLLGTVIFSLVGLVILCLGFVGIDKLTPYDLWKELVEKNNVSLAITVAAFTLGVAIIIAAAVHG